MDISFKNIKMCQLSYKLMMKIIDYTIKIS